MRAWCGLVLAIAAVAAADDRIHHCAGCALEARAWAMSGRVDPETGKDLRNYPPHRVADFTHMRLDLTIPDMDEPVLRAEQRLTFEPIGWDLALLPLDARLIEIEDVHCDGAATDWSHDGETLSISFTPPLPAGEPATIVTTYRVIDPAQGLLWTPSSEAWPGRAAQLHTQGQPETNSYWFPCHDFPHERLSTELVVTVPPGFLVSSNGRLERHSKRVEEAEREEGGHDLTGFETFHWVQERAQPNYLVTLVVGAFDVVDVGTDELPMPVYVPPGRGADVERTYGRTLRMLRLYEDLFDEPYPWDRYAQVLVWNFGAGGMENTSATTMFGEAVLSEEAAIDHSLEGLIAHELAHQWFGDLITCSSWEHIWLNEGFATYLESLWWEHVDGEEGYLVDVLANMDAVIEADRAEAPEVPGMVSKVYEHPWDVFDRGANPYPKGASILHMLRRRLGDEVFFESIATYVDRYKNSSVETPDLRKVMEEISGEALERFFDQWCERPGVPRLEVDVEWDEPSRLLTLHVAQTQPIDAWNPAFVLDLPVWIAGSGGRTGVIEMRGRDATVTYALDAEPSMVCVNPHLEILADVDVHQAWHRWRSQLVAGPTIAARVQAARALADEPDETTVGLLASVASDDDAPVRAREACVVSLGEQGAAEALTRMLRQGVADHAVRLACVEQLTGVLSREEVESRVREEATALIVLHASDDASFRVRSAAVRANGRLGLADEIGVVALALETASQYDQVRRAALEAIADFDQPELLDVAIRHAQPGTPNRTRPVAIEAIASLSDHDPSTAYYALEVLLEDRERRTWEAAVRAIVEMGDERGLVALEELAMSKRDPADVEWIMEQREAIEEKAAVDAP